MAGPLGHSVGAGDVFKPHRRREVFIKRAEQGLSSLSTRPKERRRDGDRDRLSGRLAPPSHGSCIQSRVGALERLMKTGHFTLVQEQATMKQQSERPRLILCSPEPTRNAPGLPDKRRKPLKTHTHWPRKPKARFQSRRHGCVCDVLYRTSA